MFGTTLGRGARRAPGVTLLALGLLAASAMPTARAEDLRVGARNGDTFIGDIDTAPTVDLYYVRTRPGATLRVRARSRKGSPPIHVAVLSGATTVGGQTASGRRVRVNSSVDGATLHQVFVGAKNPGDLADYQISFRWKIAARIRKKLRSAPDGSRRSVDLPVEEGERVRLELLSGRRPARGPFTARITHDDGEALGVSGTAQLRFHPDRTEDHVLTVESEQGRLPTHVVLRRRIARRVLDVRGSALPDLPGTSLVGAASPGGATRVLGRYRTDWGLMGVQLRVPEHAVPEPQVVTLFQADDLERQVPGFEGASFPIGVGPSTLALQPGANYTVNVESRIDSTEDGEPVPPRVFFRDAAGGVVEIPPERLRVDDGRNAVIIEHDAPGTFRTFVRRTPVRRAAAAATADRIAVGRPDATLDDHANAGAVDLYVRSGPSWLPDASLPAPDVRDDGQFGTAVALDGDRLVVAVREATSGDGAPVAGYVFERGGDGAWTDGVALPARWLDGSSGGETLVADDPVVVVAGDRIAIGGFRSASGGVAAPGRVLLYEKSGGAWTLTQVLHDERTSAPTVDFGRALAMDATRLVVGVPDATEGVFLPWGVQVFGRDGGTWRVAETLTVADDGGDCRRAPGFHAPTAVALDGDRIAVGASDSVFGGLERTGYGLVTVFASGPDGWQQGATLRAPHVPLDTGLDCARAEFGAALSLRGDRLLVGAPTHGGGVVTVDGAGGAFLFALDPAGPRLVATLAPPEARGDQRFGRQVVLLPGASTALVAGARSQDAGAPIELGRTLMFDVD